MRIVSVGLLVLLLAAQASAQTATEGEVYETSKIAQSNARIAELEDNLDSLYASGASPTVILSVQEELRKEKDVMRPRHIAARADANYAKQSEYHWGVRLQLVTNSANAMQQILVGFLAAYGQGPYAPAQEAELQDIADQLIILGYRKDRLAGYTGP